MQTLRGQRTSKRFRHAKQPDTHVNNPFEEIAWHHDRHEPWLLVAEYTWNSLYYDCEQGSSMEGLLIDKMQKC